MEKKMVVRVTTTEFELDDGRIFNHPSKLEDVPTPKEFQELYEQWFVVFQSILEGKDIGAPDKHR